MAQAANRTVEVGLVLQGGGALGAYEWGAIEALFEVMAAGPKAGQPVTLRAVTGASIGAINAACIVGATSATDSIARLGAMWNELILETPLFWPPQASRDLSLYGLPSFYAPRPDLLTLPSWTYVYDTHPLIQTLKDHIDFDALNASKTAFIVTAVDVESGKLQRFANRAAHTINPVTIGPEHVLASGSLPPQFPWTDIEDGPRVAHYWDGGIVDNTPLGDAIDEFSPGNDVCRLLVVMNLFPDEARLPTSLPEVTERVDQLRFGNRLKQDSKNADRINEFVATIDALANLVTSEIKEPLASKVANARKYKLVTTVEIALLPDPKSSDPDEDYGFRDFSRDGVQRRRKRGHDLAFAKLSAAFQAIAAPSQTVAH
jgi:predicted acylesterase/phospholipase RssA